MNGCRRPQDALEWITQVEQASSIEELAINGAEFEEYSTTISLSLLCIIEGDFANKIELLEESMLRQNKRLNGRQLLWLIFRLYDETDANIMFTDFTQVSNMQLHGNNLTKFLSEWKFCLQGMQVPPPDSVLEVLFDKQISRCDHVQPILNI